MKLVAHLIFVFLFTFASNGMATTPKSPLDKVIIEASQQLDFDDGEFSGPAWNTLVEQGKRSQFFLLGEEHGIAENPLLAAQLFKALSGADYQHFVIEVSPQIASIMEQRVAKNGLQGLRELYAEPGGEPAFFGMHEEAKMLADIKASLVNMTPNTSLKRGNVFLGVDYEVAADRPLLKQLSQQEMPPAARTALNKLIEASNLSWQKYYEERNPMHIFSFSADPQLVKNVRSNWPNVSQENDWLLEELEDTFRINKAWTSGQGWQSNSLRAELLRRNFLRHWQHISNKNTKPKLMVKLGASHIMQGLSTNKTFDLGTLLPTLAEIEGGKSVSLLVLPGKGSNVAVLDPVNWVYRQDSAKDGYTKGLEALYEKAGNGMTLFDMKKLRPLLKGIVAKENPALVRTVFGFDYVLIMTGSTAASDLVHD